MNNSYPTKNTVAHKKVYFPSLNGLRFIAAFLVIIHHIEQFKSIYGLDNYYIDSPFIRIIGKLGVVLFFVLSGFLITYLLLSEERSFQTISIRDFYVRRILRIWPLYFLIILLAFLALPNISIFTLPGYGKEVIYKNLFVKLVLYVLFLPNLVLSLFGVVPYASHTWSIGTEEQYYLIWPVLLKYIKKYRLGLMGIILIVYSVLAMLFSSHYSEIIPYRGVFNAFWTSFRIDCMAIGGVFSILYFQKSRLLKILLSNYLFYATILLTLFLILKGITIPYIHYDVYSILFGIIILNFAVNDRSKLSLENNTFNFLGNISYGLYMYHPIGIVLTLYIAMSFNLVNNFFIYPLSILFTILLATLSYKYFETFFLKYKKRFSKIESGSETKV